jgi:hypothetical protein
MVEKLDFIEESVEAYTKHVIEQNFNEQTFKEIFSTLNEKYVKVSGEIIKLNDIRTGILSKIKVAQTRYKELFGQGDIKPETEHNDEDEEEVKPVEKPVKKNKKVVDVKTTEVKTENIVHLEESSDEVENIPKSKTKKGVKGKKVSEPVVEELVEEAEQEEEPVPKPVKSTKLKKTLDKEAKLEVKPEAKPEAKPEVKKTTGKTKPEVEVVKVETKTVKKKPEEQVEPEVEVVKVETKTTKKKK